jgi:hypothetical protein
MITSASFSAERDVTVKSGSFSAAFAASRAAIETDATLPLCRIFRARVDPTL